MMPGVKSMSLPSHTNVCFSGLHPHRPTVKLAFTRKDIQQANTKKRLKQTDEIYPISLQKQRNSRSYENKSKELNTDSYNVKASSEVETSSRQNLLCLPKILEDGKPRSTPHNLSPVYKTPEIKPQHTHSQSEKKLLELPIISSLSGSNSRNEIGRSDAVSSSLPDIKLRPPLSPHSLNNRRQDSFRDDLSSLSSGWSSPDIAEEVALPKTPESIPNTPIPKTPIPKTPIPKPGCLTTKSQELMPKALGSAELLSDALCEERQKKMDAQKPLTMSEMLLQRHRAQQMESPDILFWEDEEAV